MGENFWIIMAEFNTKVKIKEDSTEYEINFYTKDVKEYEAVLKLCRNILDKKELSLHTKGKWVLDQSKGISVYFCSECKSISLIKLPFCSNCGADLR